MRAKLRGYASEGLISKLLETTFTQERGHLVQRNQAYTLVELESTFFKYFWIRVEFCNMGQVQESGSEVN